MQELNMDDVNFVSGGNPLFMAVFEGILGGAAYDLIKSAGSYAMKNSYMGRGQFPSVPRAGHE
jgi:hypothetical protein